MRGCGGDRRAGVEGALRFLEPCRIPGALWDLGEYPGLVEGGGEVRGELYEVELATLAALDAYEEEGSLYLRKRVALNEPRLEAWVYLYNGSLDRARPIPGGCWRTHCSRSGGSRSG